MAIAVDNKFIEDHTGFVYSVARPIAKRLPVESLIGLDDLASYGFIGLIESAKRYKSGGSATFLTFARPRIYGAMMDALRGIDTLNRYQRKRTPDFKFESSEAPWLHLRTDEKMPSPSEGVAKDMFWDYLVDGLTAIEKLVVIEYYRNGKSCRLVGLHPLIRLTESRISQILMSLRFRLADKLRRAGYGDGAVEL